MSVSIPVRYAVAVTTIASALLFAACGDSEEDFADDAVISTSASPQGSQTIPALTTSASATTNTTPIPGWSAYTDPVDRFSLSYPPDLVFSDLSGLSPADGPGRRHLQFRSPDDRSRSITIGVIVNAEELPLDQWVQRYTACLTDTIRETTLGGAPAFLCSGRPDLILEETAIVQFGDKVLLITSLLSADDFQAVLSTFER